METFSGFWVGPRGNRDGVWIFRRGIELAEAPESLTVRVSADRRYKLFVDGRLAALGPARGDLGAWPYDTVDLAPFLAAGRNVVSAIVWNAGVDAAFNEMGSRTAFLLDGDPRLDTGSEWEMAALNAWTLVPTRDLPGFWAAGPGERFDGREQPDWTELAMDDLLPWESAPVVHKAMAQGSVFEPEWALVPRPIPAMRYARREETLAENVPLPRLIDHRELLNAYPRFVLEGPVGTEVTITYAEALRLPGGGKVHRDMTEGTVAVGPHDTVILGEGRTFFEPLDWRSYRFVSLSADGPVTLRAYEAVETGYPLRPAHRIEIPEEPSLASLEEVSLRTLQRCMGETFFDTPHWERLQYAGDTRIQALMTYYLSTDRALARQAVDHFGRSRVGDGLPQSRYPSRMMQFIPPFALWWTLMRQDQRLYDRVVPGMDPADTEPLDEEGLDAVNAANRADGRHWWFADWCPEWRDGVPPGGARSTVHRLTLYLAHAATERALDLPTPTARTRGEALWRYMSARLTKDGGWVRHADDEEWAPSEHAEALLRLLQRRLMRAEDPWPSERPDVVRATYYFRHYVHEARGYDPALLEPWREMIAEGLTTFAENPAPTRSDCHAWSAHPLLLFLRKVAGIESAAPGWRAARIAPDPGPYTRFSATVPHPDGPLSVSLADGRLTVDSPVPFMLAWQGREGPHDGGLHTFSS